MRDVGEDEDDSNIVSVISETFIVEFECHINCQIEQHIEIFEDGSVQSSNDIEWIIPFLRVCGYCCCCNLFANNINRRQRTESEPMIQTKICTIRLQFMPI